MTKPRRPHAKNRRDHGPRLPPDSLAAALHHSARLIAAVRNGQTLTQAIAELAASDDPAALRQRAAIQDTAYGSLRDHALGQAVLHPLLRAEPPEPIYSLLLAARYRLDTRPENAHTIVDQAVEAAPTLHTARFGGLVNAVLRNYVRRRSELHTQAAQHDEARYRHPYWWIERVRTELPQHWVDVLDAGNRHPPMALRVNRRRCDPPTLLSALAEAGIDATAIGGSAIALATPRPITEIPGFHQGWCSVQDPGAQHCAGLLDLQPGQRVLDACAAPGGKTAHILESADVALTALEISPGRMARVRDNLRRLGLRAELRVADCRHLDDWWDGEPFDRILADVPCSASGVVRRHPDIKWLRRDTDIPAFARQQAEIMDHLWHTLAPGGKMLYVTCSVFDAENVLQVVEFCRRHADARRLPIAGKPYRQLLPCAQHDGFFYALLAKRE